jgi:protein TilB
MDLPGAARARIEKKVLDEETGANKGAYTKQFRRECYEEEVARKEESKKKSEERSMFKDYNEYEKEFMQKREIPIYNK